MAAYQRSLDLISRLALASALLAFAAGRVAASEMHGGHSGGGTVHVGPSGGPMYHHGGGHGVGGYSNGINYNPGIYLGYGVGGGYLYSPPLVVFSTLR